MNICGKIATFAKPQNVSKDFKTYKMNIGIILGTIVFGIFLFFIIKPLILLRKDYRKMESLMNPDNPKTEDLRIWSKRFSSIIYNLGSDFDYLKFQFTENECFVFCRNSFPGIYHGPFLIKEKERKNELSYLARYDLTNFSVNGNDIKIGFKHRGILGMSYKFHLQNVSNNDIELLNKNLR